MDGTFVLSILALLYSFWQIAIYIAGHRIPKWGYALVASFIGIFASVPIVVKLYKFFTTKNSRRRLFLRSLYQILLSDLYEEYNFSRWCNGNPIYCNYLFETEIHFSDDYVCVKRPGEDYPISDATLYEANLIEFEQRSFNVDLKDGNTIKRQMKNLEGEFGGELDMRNVRILSALRNYSPHWLEVKFSPSDGELWFTLRNPVFAVGKDTPKVQADIEGFAKAMHLLESLDRKGYIDFQRKCERRGAIVFHAYTPMQAYKLLTQGCELWKVRYRTRPAPCVIEGFDCDIFDAKVLKWTIRKAVEEFMALLRRKYDGKSAKTATSTLVEKVSEVEIRLTTQTWADVAKESSVQEASH